MNSCVLNKYACLNSINAVQLSIEELKEASEKYKLSNGKKQITLEFRNLDCDILDKEKFNIEVILANIIVYRGRYSSLVKLNIVEELEDTPLQMRLLIYNEEIAYSFSSKELGVLNSDEVRVIFTPNEGDWFTFYFYSLPDIDRG